MYETGLGVPVDYKKAREYYEKAANQGLAAAQFNLGYMYEMGWGVPINFTQARKYYEKAANQGLKEAQGALKRLKDS
jgi:hypothetical protein